MSDPLLLARMRKLLLLDFTPVDMQGPLENALARSVPLTEIDEGIAELMDTWGEPGEVLAGAQALLWQRSLMFRQDMLEVYQDELANYRMTLAGEFSHPDGRPVMKTRWSDVAGVQKAVLEIERGSIADRRQSLLRAAPVAPEPAVEESEEVFDEEIEIPATQLI